jgi:hypothetical protein
LPVARLHDDGGVAGLAVVHPDSMPRGEDCPEQNSGREGLDVSVLEAGGGRRDRRVPAQMTEINRSTFVTIS